MSTRDYPRLPIEQFGLQLLETRDLDPIYVALHEMKLPHEQLCRWLVSYWTFYSAGVACWMSSQPTPHDFWAQMQVAAANRLPTPYGGRWERGKERRHCRGAAGVKCVEQLAERYEDAEHMVDGLVEQTEIELPFHIVRDRVKEHFLFGDWIAYKVGDMLERLGLAPVEFSFEDAMYDSPRKVAGELWNLWNPGQPPCSWQTDHECVREVVETLLHEYQTLKAPPRYERPVGLQEIETILCCWGSHMKGFYPMYNDIDEINHGLKPWVPHCVTARQFLEAMPSRP